MSTPEREAAAVAAEQDALLSDVDWSVLPPGTVRSWFAAPSGALSAVSLGDPGDPRVVLVPGVTGSKEDFSLLAPILAENGCFVESFDLAGQYESHAAGPADGRPYDLELFANDLRAFLGAGSPAHVLGYSFGGIVASVVAIADPRLVRSLALLTTPPLAGQAFRGVRTIGWLSDHLSGRQGAGLMIWGITTNRNHVPPGRVEFARARFALTKRASVDDVIGLMMSTPDLAPGLSSLPVPRLVAVGSHDLWPTRLHVRFAQSIGARIVVYATGHSPCETAPHQLAADLLDLYAGAGDPGGGADGVHAG